MHNRGKSMKYVLVQSRRQRADPARRAEVRLQLAEHLPPARADRGARGLDRQGRSALGQLRRQPGQPQPEDRRSLGRRHQQRDAGRLHRLHRRHRGADRARRRSGRSSSACSRCTPPTSRSSSASTAWASASSGAWWCRASGGRRRQALRGVRQAGDLGLDARAFSRSATRRSSTPGCSPAAAARPCRSASW